MRLRLAGALAAALLLGGCGNLGYYAQTVGGHLQMLQAARPLDDWLADPTTPPELRRQLQLAQQLRRYAVTELALPDNASYTRYADLGRPAAVWNVVATPEFSLTLHTWCYPLMGCAGYRGYFQREQADAFAAELRAQGLEVLVYPVPAYSTLGWSNAIGGDPLLNTFVRGDDDALARLIFHELSHQVLYVSDDTRFNESYATAVERLGLRRWRASRGLPPPDDTLREQRRADFLRITTQARQQLQALYAGSTDPARDADRLRAAKAGILAELRAAHAALKAGSWQGDTGYDRWFAQANNAALALLSTYDGLVPDFERLFAQQGGDFARFHAAVQALARLPAAERLSALQRPQPAQSAPQRP